ncbi:endonuclease/exonuclease/phosphatase family protein [Spirochaetia bacterium 38H-sp]|uniref:Endonuclease/exonuclease/phosphatase family protein n=1 Tax=Rarispira pelagica TaxID=3141764 RepID=A0ABU9UDU5_9SPIR
MKRFVFIICICTSVLYADEFTLATYNVQNLFDAIHDGTEYGEFLPSEIWTESLCDKNIASIASVIKRLDADILLLQEVENISVLERMRDTFLADMGYDYIFCPKGKSATNVGVLSRIPLSYVRVHAFYREDFPYLRPVVEFSFSHGSEKFFVFAVHLKSKLGGEEKTAPAREFQLRLVAGRVRELMLKADANIIVAGDFNEREDKVEAFLDSLSGYDFLSGWELFSVDDGSYFYNGRWEKIDSFFISGTLFDGNGYDAISMTRITSGLLIDGKPLKRDYHSGEGFSDHLPLVLRISCD